MVRWIDTDLASKSFKSIDPTPCHASAHPQQHNSSASFSIHDTTSEGASTVTVSEIAARHLRRLRLSASEFLGKGVNAAVITVPTNFSETQRSALMEAAEDAGLDVLQFIHEPVAALMAYDAQPEAVATDRLVVVADLGGTRSDVAVIASRGGMYTILSTTHDYELGGVQLDQVLIDHFAKEFMKKHKTDPRENPRSLAKLKLEAEATKKALSLGSNASLSIESLVDGVDFSSTINKTRYELLAGKIFGAFTRLVEQAVKRADLDILDIDEVCCLTLHRFLSFRFN
jgi:molecular chaperone DnaK (HSP70)